MAMGRAIVRDPKVFLFDEPLSNLDAKLRASAREELESFHKRIGTTTIYVTHDQVEAMGMGDRIVVMENGVVQQIASPQQAYAQPANLGVARFMGYRNVLELGVEREQDRRQVGGGVAVRERAADRAAGADLGVADARRGVAEWGATVRGGATSGARC